MLILCYDSYNNLGKMFFYNDLVVYGSIIIIIYFSVLVNFRLIRWDIIMIFIYLGG